MRRIGGGNIPRILSEVGELTFLLLIVFFKGEGECINRSM
jgi:hypothetical protein